MTTKRWVAREQLASDDLNDMADRADAGGLSVLSVANFGALGDGTTDDTAAIQDALDAAGGGIKVVIPPDFVCRISDTLDIKDGTTLTGGGTLKPLPVASWTGGTPYRALQNENHAATEITDEVVILDDITIDYSDFGTGDGSEHGCRFRKARRVVVRNCRIIRGASSVAFLGCDDTLEHGNTYKDFTNCGSDHWDNCATARVVGCHIETENASQMLNWNPEPTSLTGTGHVANGLTVTGCVFVSHEASSTAIQIEPLATGNTVKDVVFVGNVLKNCWLSLRGDVQGAVITGNVFSDFQGNVPAIQAHSRFGVAPEGIVFAQNVVRDPLTASPNTAVIYVNSDSGLVAGNAITGAAYTVAAISTGSSNAQYDGNYIENIAYQTIVGLKQLGFRLLNGDTHYIGWLDTAGNSSRMFVNGSNAWNFNTRDASGAARAVLGINARSDTAALRCYVPFGMDDLFYPYATQSGLTATGSTSGGALLLEHEVNRVATVASGTGVRLMNISFYGLEIEIWNDGANALNVYPTTGGQIDALGTNTPYVLPAGKFGRWRILDSGEWRTTYVKP